MTVKVTLEFKSVDEAIVVLGKLAMSGFRAPQASAKLDEEAQVSPARGEKRERKPRADKGQKRGEYKPRVEEVAAPQEKTGDDSRPLASNQASVGTAAAAAPDVAPPPTATVAHEADVQAAVEKLYGDKGYDTTLAALSRYGVKRGKDLPADQRANFIADVDRILAGGAV